MEYSSDARKLLTESFESFRDKAYPDPGTGGKPWTIGYGHTKGVNPWDKCTPEQADLWLDENLADAEATVKRYVTVPLSQNQYDALVDFIYNCGAGGFRIKIGGTSYRDSTLLTKLNSGDMEGVFEEFGKWIYSGGKIMNGLIRRRAAEANWFKYGTANGQATNNI